MADNETLTNTQFLRTLFQLYIDTTLTKIPKINGKQLDFLRLFKEVRLHGGHKRVTTEKQWEKICESLFGEPLNRCGTTYVQALYNKMIIPYESQLEDFIVSGSPQATFANSETGAQESCGDEPTSQPAPSQEPGEEVLSGSSPLLPLDSGRGPAAAAGGSTPTSSPESQEYGINCIYKLSGKTSVSSVKNKCKLALEPTNRKRVTKKHPPKLNLPSFSVKRNVEREDYRPPPKMRRLSMGMGPEPSAPCHASQQAKGQSMSFSHEPSFRQADSDTGPHWEVLSPRGAGPTVPSSPLQAQAQPTHSHGHGEPLADTETRDASHPDTPPVFHAFQSQPSPPGTLTPSYGIKPSFQHPDFLLHTRHTGQPFDHSNMRLGSNTPSQKPVLPYSHRSSPQSKQHVLCPHSSQPHVYVHPGNAELADQGYLRHFLRQQTDWAERWGPLHTSKQPVRVLGPGESLHTTTGELYRANPSPYPHRPRSPCTQRPPWQSSPEPRGEAHPYQENRPYEYHLSHNQNRNRAQERPLQPMDPPDTDTPLDLSLSCDRGSDAPPLSPIQSTRNPGPRFLNAAQCVYQGKPSSARHTTGCDRDSVDSLEGRGGSHLNTSDASPSPPLDDLTESASYLDQSPLRDIDARATPSPEADMRIKYLAHPVWPRSLPIANYVPEAFRLLARLLKIMPNYEPRFDSEPFDSLYIQQHRSGN